MRIAQIAPLWEPVPPPTYGGSELIASLLTEELVTRGHDVVLFATADSKTSAKLVPIIPRGFRETKEDLRCDRTATNIMATELRMLGDAFGQADQFDVIHNHIGFQALPFANLVHTPVVTTLHNALEPEGVRELYGQYAHLPYISISEYQRELWPELNYSATIYHGIDLDKFDARFDTDDDGYLAFLGRICPEKGAHLAIEIARTVGRKLVMAGKVDEVERDYYESEVVPHLDGEQVRYIGEVNHQQKVELLRNAVATLFPIQWAEPFGLVLIESMACGTPVLAMRNGSIPEVVDHGTSGFVGESVSELIESFAQLERLDRRDCRRQVEQRFSIERMADDHERLYEQLASRRPATQASGRTNGHSAPSISRSSIPIANEEFGAIPPSHPLS